MRSSPTGLLITRIVKMYANTKAIIPATGAKIIKFSIKSPSTNLINNLLKIIASTIEPTKKGNAKNFVN